MTKNKLDELRVKATCAQEVFEKFPATPDASWWKVYAEFCEVATPAAVLDLLGRCVALETASSDDVRMAVYAIHRGMIHGGAVCPHDDWLTCDVVERRAIESELTGLGEQATDYRRRISNLEEQNDALIRMLRAATTKLNRITSMTPVKPTTARLRSGWAAYNMGAEDQHMAVLDIAHAEED